MRQGLAYDAAAQPYENLFVRPGLHAEVVGTAGTPIGFGAWQGTSPNAAAGQVIAATWAASGKAWRWTWSARTVASGDIGLSIGRSSGVPDWDSKVVGRRMTVVFDCVVSADCTVTAGGISNVVGGTVTFHSSFAPVAAKAGQPFRCWTTFTAGAGVTTIGSVRAVMANLPLTAGAYAEVCNVQLYEGDYRPAVGLSDGTVPGWKWTGAVGASSSVGYPYTLESIAGQPLASLLTPATTVNASVAVPDLGAFAARTLYTVYDVVDQTPNFAIVATSFDTGGSTATTGQFRIATGGSGVDSMGSRVDFTGGSQNVTLSRASLGARTVGRHVASLALNSGLTQQTLRVDGITATSGATIPGSGLTFAPGGARLQHPTGGGNGQVSHLYAGEHNEQTARRIMAWLARRYGAPVPTGY